MITQDQLKDVLDRTEKLNRYLKTCVRRLPISGKTRSVPKSR